MAIEKLQKRLPLRRVPYSYNVFPASRPVRRASNLSFYHQSTSIPASVPLISTAPSSLQLRPSRHHFSITSSSAIPQRPALIPRSTPARSSEQPGNPHSAVAQVLGARFMEKERNHRRTAANGMRGGAGETKVTASADVPRFRDRQQQQQQQQPDAAQRATLRQLISKRQYQLGDVYSPGDLRPRAEEAGRVRPPAPSRDVFDVLGVDPLEEYKVRFP